MGLISTHYFTSGNFLLAAITVSSGFEPLRNMLTSSAYVACLAASELFEISLIYVINDNGSEMLS